MKSKVYFSNYCKVVTFAVIFALGMVIYQSQLRTDTAIYVSAVFFIVLFCGLFYCPLTLEATDKELIIHRALWKNKVLPYADIKSAESCLPSAGGLRLCGSGGFMGYWGYFNDTLIGPYFGYYADYKECFLIRMKNGKQYVLSCREHKEMLRFLQNILDSKHP